MNMRLDHQKKFARVFVPFSFSALGGAALAHTSPAALVQDGNAGFVIAYREFGLAHDAQETGACLDGMTSGTRPQGSRIDQAGTKIWKRCG
jgi:hypothetical protein